MSRRAVARATASLKFAGVETRAYPQRVDGKRLGRMLTPEEMAEGETVEGAIDGLSQIDFTHGSTRQLTGSSPECSPPAIGASGEGSTVEDQGAMGGVETSWI